MLKKNILVPFLLIILSLAVLPHLVSADSTTVQVDPSDLTVTIGETFNVNVTVTDVTNLTCWEFRLYYLNAVLNCTAAVEGPFLQTVGGTFFDKTITNNYNSTHGRVQAYCTLLGLTSVDGSGTLTTITFKAIGGGDTPLHLDKTKLGDEKIPPEDILHTAIDGTVHVTTAIHDVAVTDVTPLKTVVCQGYSMKINVTVENQGDKTETFNVTTYANTTVIETKETTVPSGNSTTITLTWNATGFAKGNYAVSAYATPVPGETDLTDNNFVNGIVTVTHIGDINGDGKVDLSDVLAVALAFGSFPGQPLWNPNLDVDGNGKVDLTDYLATALNYGYVDP